MVKIYTQKFSREKLLNNIERLKHWGVKGGLAVLDQGLFSGTNFILNLMLARWLTPNEYGAFTISFTVYIFLTGFYIAIILEPASVLGPARHMSNLSSYIRDLFKIHFIMCSILSIIMLGVGLLLLITKTSNALFAFAMLGNGLSLTFTLLLWLVRRSFYIFHHPELAVIGSLVFFILSVFGVYGLHLIGAISVFKVFVIIGLASLIGSSFSLWTGRNLFTHAPGYALTWMEILSEQWQFGKWRTIGGVLAITFGQMQTFFVAGMLGLPAVGALRALQNFILPIIQVETAIESLGLSSVSSISGGSGTRNYQVIKKKSFLIAFSLFCMSIIYALILYFFAEPLEKLLYFGKYSAYVGLIPLLGLSPIFLALAMGFVLPLLSIGKSKYYIVIYAINAPISIALTFLLTKNYGITGSVVSILIPSIVNVLVAATLFYFWSPQTTVRENIL